MEQSNNQQNSLWYKFPISVVDRKLDELLDGEIPEEDMIDSWVDIRIDSIVMIRPYYVGDDLKITGTLLYTTAGTDFAVNMKPSSVRKLLNYEPIKLENEFKTPPM